MSLTARIITVVRPHCNTSQMQPVAANEVGTRTACTRPRPVLFKAKISGIQGQDQWYSRLRPVLFEAKTSALQG